MEDLREWWRQLTRRRKDSLYGAKPRSDAATEHDALLQEIQQAVEQLREVHQRAAEAFELRYFGRLRLPVIAMTIERSEDTGARDLRFARAWVMRALQNRPRPGRE